MTLSRLMSTDKFTSRCLYDDNYSPPSFEELLNGVGHKCPIFPSTVVMRRVAFDACGGFNEQMTACEDAYLWIRAREHGEFRFLPEVLTRREFGPSPAREQWYVDGARALNEAAHERYGSRFSGDSLYWMLRWSAWSAYWRGDRKTALRRYLAAARRKPVRAKIYLLMVLALVPRRIIAAIATVMPREIEKKLMGRI